MTTKSQRDREMARRHHERQQARRVERLRRQRQRQRIALVAALVAIAIVIVVVVAIS